MGMPAGNTCLLHQGVAEAEEKALIFQPFFGTITMPKGDHFKVCSDGSIKDDDFVHKARRQYIQLTSEW